MIPTHLTTREVEHREDLLSTSVDTSSYSAWIVRESNSALRKLVVLLHLALEENSVANLAEAEVNNTALLGVAAVKDAINFAR